MSAELSSVAIEEKNKIAATSVFFSALEITIPGMADTVKVCDLDEEVTWNGSTWQPFPMKVEDVVENAGEVPSLVIKVSNVNRAFESYLQQYDAYCKANGYSPIKVKLYALNSKALHLTTYEAMWTFNLEKPASDAEWVTFTLGAGNPFTRRFPQNRILKNHCRFKFKSAMCGYNGSQTTCSKTLVRCRQLSNSARFGGFPGVGAGGLRVSSD